MNNDAEHLRLLVIGHYVAAAITALVACFPLIHLTVGVALLLNPPPAHNSEEFPVPLVGLLFALIGGAFVLAGWTLAACIFVAGRSITARKRYYFCLVVAGVSCAFFPFGTVLGVFSLLVLLRPSVKAWFLPQSSTATPPTNTPQPGAWRDEPLEGQSDG
jgi:hypothetical protein